MAGSAADVAAAVKFAREHRLRLVIKGGGHSYQGTSNAAGALMISTRPMNAVVLHDAFTPQGCEGVMKPQPAASVGAGAMWIDVYDAVTTKAGRYAQGGGCTTVGVAGHIQSGGYGSLSKRFGTSSGNLLEAEVVTADGEIRIANPRRNPELFWALKGGGGGSFGVITRVTVRTHDLPEHFGWAEGGIRATSDAAYRRLIGRFMAFYADNLFNPHWGEQVKIRPDNGLGLSMVSQGLDDAESKALWAPFFDWVRTQPADYKIIDGPEVGAGHARGWWDVVGRKARGSDDMVGDDRPGAPAHHAVWRGDGDQASMYLHGYESLWLPASLLKPDQRGRLVDALFAASRHFQRAAAPQQRVGRRRARGHRPSDGHGDQSRRHRRVCAGDHRHRRLSASPRPSDTAAGHGVGRAQRPRHRRRQRRAHQGRAGARLLCLGEQLFQPGLERRLLGPELSAVGGGEDEVRSGGVVLRAPRRGE